MRARSVVGEFDVRGHALVLDPLDEGAVARGVEAGVHMQGHELDGEGQDGPADEERLHEHEAVHAAGHGHADARAGSGHARRLHQLAHGAHAFFLREGKFAETGHVRHLISDRIGSRAVCHLSLTCNRAAIN